MLIRIDLQSDVPLYLQLRNELVLAIAAGQLLPGQKLPSVRQLAGQLGVNAMTVQKSYNLLKAQGFVVTDRKRGTVVSSTPPSGQACCAQLQDDLALLAAQAGLGGLSQQEFLQLCAQCYRSITQKPAGEGGDTPCSS